MIDERPLVGLLAAREPGESGIGREFERQTVAAIVQSAKAVPVIVPTGLPPEHAPLLAGRIDAVLVFGEPGGREDGFVAAMIAAAMSAARPVFGTGGGFLAINAALGGQAEAPVAADFDPLGNPQKLDIAVGSVLQRVAGSATLLVGGTGCGAVRTLGEGLVANATTPEASIAAISAPHMAAPVFAVNWHPEWQADEAPHDKAFWRFLGETARATYLAAPGAGLAPAL